MTTGASAAASNGTAVFRPHPKRDDWYVIPADWLPEIARVPSVQFDNRFGPVVHRSHLPVLATRVDEVASFLSQLGSRQRLGSDRDSDRAAFDALTEPLGWKLRDYQHAGREFIRDRQGTLLADNMRLGKTITATASHDPSTGPLVIVAPLPTREVWLGWAKRVWPSVKPVVLCGRLLNRDYERKRPRRERADGTIRLHADRFERSVLADAEVIFSNYEILPGWPELAHQPIGTLILDEAHVLSNRRTWRTQAALALAATAKRVIAVTGTPLWNRPEGLWSVLACTCPGAWGKYYDFCKRYAGAYQGPYGMVVSGSSCEDEFRLRMQEVMILRRWRDVMDELPAIERTTEIVDINERQSFQIEKQAEKLRNSAKQTTTVGALARFRRLLAKLKLPGTVDAAKRILAENEHVVIWTWHRDIALEVEKKLTEAGHPGIVVTGNTGADQRELLLERWRKAPAAPLVISMAVGQVGIDLSTARHAIFAELDFTPSVVAQAEMRTFASTRPMAITYVIVDHDIDRKLLDALQAKCETAMRMGTPAAETAIDVLQSAFAMEAQDELAMLAAAVLADHPDISETEDEEYTGTLWLEWDAE